MKRFALGCALAASVVAATISSSTEASFAGQTENPGNVFSIGALYAPSGLGATVSGHDVSLSWTAGTGGSGYKVYGVSNGTNSNCTGAAVAQIGTSASTSYADSGRYSPEGTYYCYEVRTSYGSAWTSVTGNPMVAARIGFFAQAVSQANGGVPNRLDTGDVITVTFDQAVTTSTGPSGTNTVCAVATGQILLGSTTTSGACSTAETTNLGTLTGGTAAANGRFNATYAWSNGSKTLTVTLGTRTSGTSTITTSGTRTLNPTTTSSKLQSATGAFHVCDTNAGGGDCLPTASGSF
jgi:hypothetical protein